MFGSAANFGAPHTFPTDRRANALYGSARVNCGRHICFFDHQDRDRSVKFLTTAAAK
jgi:hypothetical protein